MLKNLGLLFVLSMILTSCVATSNWLAAPPQLFPLDSNNNFDSIQIGVSSKQEILDRFGNPFHQQFHSVDGNQIESLSYSFAETEVRPSQYILLLGAIPFLKSFRHQTPSAAISFTPQEIVSGVTFSTFNAYGAIPSSQVSAPDPAPSFFGMRNPDVFHSPTKKNLLIP